MRSSEPHLPKARLPFWRRLGWRLGASVLLLTALGILVSGLLQYRAQEQWIRQSLGSLLLNIARTGVLLVDGDLHQKVVKEGRTDSPAYTEVWARLRRIQEANQLADAVYTLFDVEGDSAKFAVVSTPGRSARDFVPVGLGYRLAREIQPILKHVLVDNVCSDVDETGCAVVLEKVRYVAPRQRTGARDSASGRGVRVGRCRPPDAAGRRSVPPANSRHSVATHQAPKHRRHFQSFAGTRAA